MPNAVAGKDNIELEIFGMEGIPEGDRIARELALQGESSLNPTLCVYLPDPKVSYIHYTDQLHVVCHKIGVYRMTGQCGAFHVTCMWLLCVSSSY